MKNLICIALFLGIMSLSNHLSLYKNWDKELNGNGYTIQAVAVNVVQLGAPIVVEFVLDKNYSPFGDNHYYEVGIVKNLAKKISLNTQMTSGTYSPRLYQVGIRYTF